LKKGLQFYFDEEKVLKKVNFDIILSTWTVNMDHPDEEVILIST